MTTWWEIGIDYDTITDQLEHEGTALFVASDDALIAQVEQKRSAYVIVLFERLREWCATSHMLSPELLTKSAA